MASLLVCSFMVYLRRLDLVCMGVDGRRGLISG